MSSYAERTKRPPRTFTARELAKILKAAGQAADGFRDRVIISLAVAMGLRQSEIVALEIGDVAKEDGRTPKRTIQLRVFKRSGRGANPKDHRLPVPDSTFYLLEKYLTMIRAWEYYRETRLFTSRKNQSLSTRAVRAMFQKWQAAAGIDQRIGFHCLRHTAITNVRKVSDIKHAQRFARHANITSTARYDHVSDDELAAAVKGLPG